jgi:hypothetical protein
LKHFRLKAKLNQNSTRILWAVFYLAVPLTAFIFILASRQSYLIRPRALGLRYGFTLVAPALALTAAVAFALPGRWGRVVALSVMAGVFAFGLQGLWTSGKSEYYAISALLPIDDANIYFTDARRLLTGWKFSDLTAWRPLFPALLATILALAGENIQLSVSILTALTCLAIIILTDEVQRTHGLLAGVFIFVFMFFFYRRFSGVMAAENLGIVLGTLGFALLWRGAALRRQSAALVGFFLLSLALFARLGAFLILPTLLLWGGWFFAPEGRRFAWRFMLQAAGAALGGLMVYLLVMGLFTTRPQLPTAYFADVFYSLTTGYPTPRGAVEASVDHPEFAELPPNERTAAVYRLAFEQLRADPSGALDGALYQWSVLFSDTWYATYSYLASDDYPTITRVVYISLYLLCLIALVGWVRQRCDPALSLTLAAWVGILLSIPFVPPSFHNRVRLLAATIPAFGLLPMLGMVLLLRWFKLRWLLAAHKHPLAGWVAPGLGLGLAVFMVAGPLTASALTRPLTVPEIPCGEDYQPIVVRLAPGSQVHIAREDQNFQDWLPRFHVVSYIFNLHNMPYYALIEELEAYAIPPLTLINGLDLNTGRQVYILTHYHYLSGSQAQPELMAACGKWSDNPETENYEIYYLKTFIRYGPDGRVIASGVVP